MENRWSRWLEKQYEEAGSYESLAALCNNEVRGATPGKIITGASEPKITTVKIVSEKLGLSLHEAAHAAFGLDEPTGTELTDEERECLENFRKLDMTAKKHVSWAMQQFIDAITARQEVNKKTGGRTKRAAGKG